MSSVANGHALRVGSVHVTTGYRGNVHPRRVAHRPRGVSGVAVIFVLVFAAELSFGAWMAARGFRWNDAMSRAASALSVLHSADPKLANIGFVWPPLPALLDVIGAVFYPAWPGIVSSGVAAALTTATCAGLAAALLLATARRLGLSDRIGWTFALLVALHPMLFLYGSNGMSEGVAAPFLIGAVCALTLFWHTGERLWVAAAGLALAFGVATEYTAVPFGAAVCAALVGGVLWSSETGVWKPQGRGRAIEALGLLLAVPPVFAGFLWLTANAVIMGNPLSFIYGTYGYGSFQRAADPNGPVAYVTGDIIGALALVGERVFPFLIPLAFVLLVRLVDGRLWRVNTLSVLVMGLSVPLGMVFPLAVLGSPMGFLRYLVYPLFVAAGWGLYEIALSRRRRTAVALIIVGWLAALPAGLWIMSNPSLGPEEHVEVEAVVQGFDGTDTVDVEAPVARYLEADILPRGRNVLFDSVAGGAMIAVQIRPAYIGQLIVTADRRFKDAVAHPGSHGVGYFLMPDPTGTPTAAIGRTYPRLWDGKQPGFRLVKTVRTKIETWRIFAVQPSERRATTLRGGAG
jgi:4-amino-4-deoxy-L-arabinose transferase-like glycosyltransferase